MSFITSGADSMPTLFCIGEVAEIQPTRESKKGTYLVTEFKITPLGAANKEARGYLTWHPDYMKPGYAPSMEKDKGRKMVYDSNIARDSKGFNPVSTQYKGQAVGLANLQGLCGSAEKFKEVGEELQAAYAAAETPDDLVAAFDVIVGKLIGTTVGYCLKQQWVPVEGSDNGNGYPIRVPGKYYELAGMFYPTKESLEAIEEGVEKAKSYAEKKGNPQPQVYICFDGSVPF